MGKESKSGIEWELSDATPLNLTRNVGGIFKLYNDGPGEIRLVTDNPNVDNPANHIRAGRAILIEIARGSDLVIGLVSSAQIANGTFELVSTN